MKNLILVSHGNLCVELKKTAEMIMGEQEKIYTVPLLESEREEAFYNKFQEIVSKLDDFVVFSDLLGGIPCNVLSKEIMEGTEFELYTGMNLPMVLSFINSSMTDSKEDYITEAVDSIVKVNDLLQSSWFEQK